MASADNRTRKLLKVKRDCERSRVEGQVIAAAYELVMPLLRRALPAAVADRPTAVAEQSQPRTGGNRA